MLPNLADFLEELTHTRQASAHTISAYRRDLQQFAHFMQTHMGQEITLLSLQNCKQRDLRAWLAARINEGKKPTSNARALSALRSYVRFLHRKMGLELPEILRMRSPKLPAALPKSPSQAQTKAALDGLQISDQNSDSPAWVSLRNEALAMLLYGTGLRISEALSLRADALNSDHLRVVGKGNKMRQVPLLPIVRARIEAYLAASPHHHGDFDGALFMGERGKRLQAAVFQRVLRDMRRALNLPESLTPHALRHAFATHLLSGGAAIRDIQELLGHASLSTTQRYTKIDVTRLISAYQSAHPRG
jgi:integrase/recombinase XerC